MLFGDAVLADLRKRRSATLLVTACCAAALLAPGHSLAQETASGDGAAPATQNGGDDAPGAANPVAGQDELTAGLTVGSGGWVTTVRPFFEQAVTFSDNIDLDPDDEAVEDYISTSTVGVDFNADTARLKTDGGLSISYDASLGGNSDDETRINSDVEAVAAFVPDRFFVEAFADIREELVNENSGSSGNDTAGQDGREREINLGVAPFVIYPIEGLGEAEVKAAYSTVLEEGDEAEDSWTQVYSAALRTAPQALDGATVELSGSYTNFNNIDDEDDSRDLWTVALGAETPLSSTFAINGTVGYDDVSPETDFDNETSGPFANVGFRYVPSQTLNATGFLGWRFGGVDFGGEVSYQATDVWGFRAEASRRLDAFGLDARQRLNTEADFGDDDDPAIRDEVVLQATAQTGKTTLNLNASAERAELQGDEEGESDEITLRASADFDRQFGFTAWTYGAGVGYEHFIAGEADDVDTDTVDLGLKVSYQLNKNVSIFTRYGFTQRFADESNDEYIENFAVIGIRGQL